MPYQVKWLIDNRVIVEKVWGVFDDSQAQVSDQEIVSMLEQSPSSVVHIVLDVSEIDVQMSTAAVRQLTLPIHPKFGWLVVYRIRNSLVRALLLYTVAKFNMRLRLVETQADALEFLSGLDVSPAK